MNENKPIKEAQYARDIYGEWRKVHKLSHPKVGMDPAIHTKVLKNCNFLRRCLDMESRIVNTCSHPQNTPPPNSWMSCDPMSCPLGGERGNMIMNERERLIELLGETPGIGWSPSAREMVADHLLANGVTVDKDTNVPTKWIPASDPPKEE